MKKNSEYSSCKDLPKKPINEIPIPKIKDKQIPPFTTNPSLRSQKSCTLAQAIPTLPESKFFPSSGRNLHISQNFSHPGHTVSANISTTNSANNSVVNLANLSVQRAKPSETSLNYSVCTQKNEVSEKPAQWVDIALPTTPAFALKNFANKLTSFEQSEILKYPAVFSIGIEAKKIKNGIGSAMNYGFDDENGDYRPAIKDHIAYRYTIFEIIGKGSFGQVFRVFDFKHQCFCALKMIRNKSRFHQQAAIEIEVLKVLRQKDQGNSYNVVHIQSSFNFRSHIVIDN